MNGQNTQIRSFPSLAEKINKTEDLKQNLKTGLFTDA